MNDHLLVEALREREPGATAAVYDAHARRLYAYCWFRLRCRDAAQVALRDAFIVAEAHIGELRDPGRFRPWLYAIARQECERRLPPRLKAPDVPVATHDQEDVDQRITAWHAVLALRPVSREILELRIRRRLSVPDLAAVLGLSLKDVQQALDDAHSELEEALAAEILAQQGPYGCAQRAMLLRERSGEPAHAVSRRLMEHTEECSVCRAFRPRAVSARKVYGLLPDPYPTAELRLRVMSCFLDPELVGYRLFVATRFTEFTPDGFPVPVEGSGRKIRSGGRRSWFGRLPKASPAARESGVRAPVVRAAMVLAVLAFLSGGGVASMYGVLGSARKPAGTAGDPRPTAIPGVSQAPATALPEPPSVPVSEVEPGGAKGALAVAPLFLDLAGGSDGFIEVHAEGGPVVWRAAVQGPIRVEPSSGRLQAGQSITVRVHVSRRPDERGNGTITFRPGSAQVRVTWRQDAPPPGSGPSPTPTGSAPQIPSAPPETQRPESPHPTPSGTRPPESPPPSSQPPSSQPPSTPSPAPPSSSTPEPTPSPAERSSGSTSPSVSPASTG